MRMTIKRILAWLGGFVIAAIVFTLAANMWVESKAKGRIYEDVDSIPHNKVALLPDIWTGKQPHFLGEKIAIPERPLQISYSTTPGVTIEILNVDQMTLPIDSIEIKLHNRTDSLVIYGEYFELQSQSSSTWENVKIDHRYQSNDSVVYIVWNAIAYLLFPHTSHSKTEKPWFYGENLVPGHYRLAKDIFIGEYTHKKDSVYVEFEIR